MRYKIIGTAILLLFLTTGCVPSRTFVHANEEDRMHQLNEELQGKVVTTRLKDGHRFKGKNVYLTSDSLFYANSEKQQGLALTQIKSITASPKVGVSKILGIPLVAAGIFGFASFDDRGGFEELGKIYGGAAAVILGGIILGVGNNIESETYYFDENR